VAGSVGVTFRVVSRGSCARAALPPAHSNAIVANESSARRDPCRAERTELVVCVSLTHARTVYFTR
jgi:hypothetical protein